MDGSRPGGFAEGPVAGISGVAAEAAGLLTRGPRFRVRAIRLAPGQALALQSHLHRAKVWVVVEGTVRVVIAERAILASEGDTIRVAVGQPHRAENPGRLSALLIAVETGGYLGEDDVIRHDPAVPPG